MEEVEVDKSDLYKVADIVPSVDLGRLKYVFVVVGSDGEADGD